MTRRFIIPFSLIALALTSVSQVSAQFGDVLNRARRKAQEQIQKAGRSPSTVTPTNGTNPGSAPSSGTSYYAFCHARGSKNTYLSDIFPFPPPDAGSPFKPRPEYYEITKQFGAYIFSRYGEEARNTGCPWFATPEIAKRQRDQLTASATGSTMPPIVTDFRWNGAVQSATSSSQPELATPEAPAGHPPSTSQPAPYVPPDATATNYAFCAITYGDTRYYSKVVTLPATAGHTVPLGISRTYPKQFSQYLAEHYHPVGKPNAVVCGDSWATKPEAESKLAMNLEGFRGSSIKIVDTDYHWTDKPNKTSEELAYAKQRSPADLYTYCFVYGEDGQVFVSDIFVTHDTSRADLYKVIPDFKQFIANKYGLPTLIRATNSHGCEDGLADRSEVDRNRAKSLADYRSHVQGGVFEVHWVPNVTSSPSVISGASSTARPNNDQLQAALEAEHRFTPEYCDRNTTLSSGYDCACFADKVQAVRIAGPTQVTPGGHLMPQLGVLIDGLDLRSCVDPQKVKSSTSAATFAALRPQRDMPETRKQAVADCTSKKLLTFVTTDPTAHKFMIKSRSEFMMTCAAGR